MMNDQDTRESVRHNGCFTGIVLVIAVVLLAAPPAYNTCAGLISEGTIQPFAGKAFGRVGQFLTILSAMFLLMLGGWGEKGLPAINTRARKVFFLTTLPLMVLGAVVLLYGQPAGWIHIRYIWTAKVFVYMLWMVATIIVARAASVHGPAAFAGEADRNG